MSVIDVSGFCAHIYWPCPGRNCCMDELPRFEMNKDKIVEYYDTCDKDYRLVWHLDRCMAMHMGFWDEDTKRISEALIRENDILAQQANITPNDRVLDAGCGVGGSSIHLAKNYGCHVTGITLSGKQVESAEHFADRHGVSDKTNFQIADYTKTPFKDESFDVIWAVESVCYAQDKNDFIKEAHRLLKPGGRLIVADGFQRASPLSPKEERLLSKSYLGWEVHNLETDARFRDGIESHAFSNIREDDVTPMVMTSSRRLHLYSYLAFFVNIYGWLRGRRGRVEMGNVVAAYNQYKSLKRGIWTYKTFYAEKLG